VEKLWILIEFCTSFPSKPLVFATTHPLLACGMAKMSDGGKVWYRLGFVCCFLLFPQVFSTNRHFLS
jgi:hypothetical protein